MNRVSVLIILLFLATPIMAYKTSSNVTPPTNAPLNCEKRLVPDVSNPSYANITEGRGCPNNMVAIAVSRGQYDISGTPNEDWIETFQFDQSQSVVIPVGIAKDTGMWVKTFGTQTITCVPLKVQWDCSSS